jgi:hypothetical protein
MTYTVHTTQVCVVCRQPEGEPHIPGCPVPLYTIGRARP